MTRAEPVGIVRSRDMRPATVQRRIGLAWTSVASRDGRQQKGHHMPRAQIKDEKTYRALREEGQSKEKAARIANAAAATSRSAVGRKGGKSPSYETWTKQDLVRRAAEIGIKGRSTMRKAELIQALRNH
jgi:hypothetical protein